jgi:hypothetical protein
MTKSKFGTPPEVGHHYRVRIHCGDDIVRHFEGETFQLPAIEFSAVVGTAAVASALRAATGRPLTRVPVKPDDIVGL